MAKKSTTAVNKSPSPAKAKPTNAKPSKNKTGDKPATRVILETMALLYARGTETPERKKVASLTALNPKTMANAVTKLKQKDLLECPSGDTFKLTDKGVEELSEFLEGEIGKTNEEVHEKIKAKLKGKEVAFFDLLVDGAEHDKEVVAKALGFVDGKKQKGFQNLAGVLKNKHSVVFYPTKDTVQLVKDVCFPWDD